ncbi:hypothetical protein BVX98_08035 [bacterium F11]|nr:hypothetical protein BVX98_08035 [bacterium F11]
MRLGLAQLNPILGDIEGNTTKILEAVQEAKEKGCQLVLVPELALTGYPPEDLIFKSAFIKDNLSALKKLASSIRDTALLVGFIDEKKGKCYNAAAYIHKGRIHTIHHKNCLPNYGVFDEARYFAPGINPSHQIVNKERVGITICEDLWWGPNHLRKLKNKKPHFVVNLSASPYHMRKFQIRFDAIKKSAEHLKSPIIYCNMVGGQDELVYDGGSFVVLPNGKLAARFPQFQNGLFVFDLIREKKQWKLKTDHPFSKDLPEEEEILQALILGTRDYVNKNGFEKVTLGLSGGIDSALVATIAVKALGSERVVGVTMPSRFNQPETREDAKRLADNLGIALHEIPIEDIFLGYQKSLAPIFEDTTPNVAEENVQARIRGNLLMALSNKFGWLVLTTGNKSETSTGYCTLYGDMAGGFSVLKDVLKKTVYRLANHINSQTEKEIIPHSIIARPPTAELRSDQRDEDTLGSYENLDPLISKYVEKNWSIKKMIKNTQVDEAYAKRIVNLIDQNEYKRRQAPPGIKITSRAFGRDHRMPITNRYKMQ